MGCSVLTTRQSWRFGIATTPGEPVQLATSKPFDWLVVRTPQSGTPTRSTSAMAAALPSRFVFFFLGSCVDLMMFAWLTCRRCPPRRYGGASSATDRHHDGNHSVRCV